MRQEQQEEEEEDEGTSRREESLTLTLRSLVSKVVPEVLEHMRVEEGRTVGTLDRYRKSLERFAEMTGDPPVGHINSESVMLYKKKLLDAGLSPATIGGALSCLRSFLRFLRDVQRLDVFEGEKIKRPRVPQREVEYLTKEEVRRFLEAIPRNTRVGLRDRALAEVLCSTGMRISEALSLDRDRIDWEVRDALIVGKGNKQRRVYFSESAVAVLAVYLDSRDDNCPALFITQGADRRRLDAHGAWKRFQRYARLAGLGKRVYPHMLRHTMATTLLANGCPIGHIRTLLGHAHLATTCRYYLGMMSNREAKAAHERYLSYEDAFGQKPNEKVPGDENDRMGTLTEWTA